MERYTITGVDQDRIAALGLGEAHGERQQVVDEVAWRELNDLAELELGETVLDVETKLQLEVAIYRGDRDPDL